MMMHSCHNIPEEWNHEPKFNTRESLLISRKNENLNLSQSFSPNGYENLFSNSSTLRDGGVQVAQCLNNPKEQEDKNTKTRSYLVHQRKQDNIDHGHMFLQRLESNHQKKFLKEQIKFKNQQEGNTNELFGLKWNNKPQYLTRTVLNQSRQQDNVKQLETASILYSKKQNDKYVQEMEDISNNSTKSIKHYDNNKKTRSQIQNERKLQFIHEASKFEPKKPPGIHSCLQPSFENLALERKDMDMKWWQNLDDYCIEGVGSLKIKKNITLDPSKERCISMNEIMNKRSNKFKISDPVSQTYNKQIHSSSDLLSSSFSKSNQSIGKQINQCIDQVFEYKENPSISKEKYDTVFCAPLFSSFTIDHVFHEENIKGYSNQHEKNSSLSSEFIISSKDGNHLTLDKSKKNTKKIYQQAKLRKQQLKSFFNSSSSSSSSSSQQQQQQDHLDKKDFESIKSSIQNKKKDDSSLIMIMNMKQKDTNSSSLSSSSSSSSLLLSQPSSIHDINPKQLKTVSNFQRIRSSGFEHSN